jgi:hypothetical protein
MVITIEAAEIRKSNISAIFLTVIKSTEKLHMCELTGAGIAANDPIFAAGHFVAKSLPVQMSFKDTGARIRVRNVFSAKSASRDLCEVITYQSISRPI